MASKLSGREVRLDREGRALMKLRNLLLKLAFAGPLLLVSVSVAAAAQHADSDKLFTDIYRVLTHPRCLNCHPRGDSPKQGLDAHVHMPPVERGPGGNGVAGLECAACHQSANYRASGVPGALNWRLAPLSMAWENLSPGQLCRALLDQGKNGNRDLKATVAHLTADKLVAWGWAPGVDAGGKERAPVPISKRDFIRIVHAWAQLGAPCPQ